MRQAKVMGFETPTAYLLQALAATLAGNEADTYTNDLGARERLRDQSTVTR